MPPIGGRRPAAHGGQAMVSGAFRLPDQAALDALQERLKTRVVEFNRAGNKVPAARGSGCGKLAQGKPGIPKKGRSIPKKGKAKPRVPFPRETEVLSACLKLLAVHPACAFAFRANSGGMKTEAGQYVKFGFRGMPDILGCLKGGRLLAVEVKRPGKSPTADQNAFLFAVNQAGGFGCWTDSVDKLAALLDKLPLEIHNRQPEQHADDRAKGA
jgi:hypothetical protein